MPTAQLPSCAAGVPVFQVLPSEALAELSPSLRHRRFARGETIAHHGEPSEHLIVIASGQARLVHTAVSGREQSVRVLEQGDFLGELGLFVPVMREGDLVAIDETTACLVPRDAVQRLLVRYPEVSRRLVESLAQRLAETEQLLVDVGLRDVGGRLAAALYRLAASQAAAAGSASDGGPGKPAPPVAPEAIVRLPYSWAQLAIRLGTTPESLSRRLKTMARQGLIEHRGKGREVVLLDPERIRSMAGL